MRDASTPISIFKSFFFTILIICCFYPSQAILADNSLENPLDSVEVLQDQLEFLPFLCRFQVSLTYFCFWCLKNYSSGSLV